MAGEAMDGAQSVVATIQPAVILLGLGVAAALGARAVRLNPIVGYLGLGFVLAAMGFANDFRGSVVSALAEAGIMFLLFNLGLHFSLGRIRAEAATIFGFGALQMAIVGGAFVAFFAALGLPLAFAVIGGLAMGLSSTAVVIGLVRERGQEDCPVGRTGIAILIFQDIVAVLLLVAATTLGTAGDLLPALGLAGLKSIAAFILAVLFARYLTEPMFRLIARAGTAEVYTAAALFVALAAGWATGAIGLSLTLGAFLGGMALADSRYRILVETETEAFRGLFLSFFFIYVGLKIDPALLWQNAPLVLLAAGGLIALKCGLNLLAALVNRWSVPGSIQLGFLLGQGSEFALVLLAMPGFAGLVEPVLVSTIITAIAISMALSPFVSTLGRRLAGRLRQGPPDAAVSGETAPVVIVGMGQAGRAVADALAVSHVAYLAVEPDNARFEQALADGYKVYRANAADPRSWEPLGMGRRKVVVLASGKAATSRELSALVQARLPEIERLLALTDVEAQDEALRRELEAQGLVPLEANSPEGLEQLINRVFAAIGEARRRGVRMADEAPRPVVPAVAAAPASVAV